MARMGRGRWVAAASVVAVLVFSGCLGAGSAPPAAKAVDLPSFAGVSNPSPVQATAPPRNQPPVAAARVLVDGQEIAPLDGRYNVPCHAPVLLDAGGSRDPDGGPVTVVWQVLGESRQSTTTEIMLSSASHMRVVLRVTDEKGASGERILDFLCDDSHKARPPEAAPTLHYYVLVDDRSYSMEDGRIEATAGEPVLFDASRSTGAQGERLHFRWSIQGSGVNQPSFWHTFASPGRFEVSVAVFDDRGRQDQAAFELTVLARPAPASGTFLREQRSEWSVEPVGAIDPTPNPVWFTFGVERQERNGTQVAISGMRLTLDAEGDDVGSTVAVYAPDGRKILEAGTSASDHHARAAIDEPLEPGRYRVRLTPDVGPDVAYRVSLAADLVIA